MPPSLPPRMPGEPARQGTLDQGRVPDPPLLTVVDQVKKLTPKPRPLVPTVLQAGVDDITLNLHIEDPERRRMLDHWAVGHKLGTQTRDGFQALWPPHQASWFPSTGTLSIQAKRARKLDLVPLHEVPVVAQELVGVLVGAGLLDRGARPYGAGEMSCSRIDVALDVEMPTGQAGLDFLTALEGMRDWGGLYVDGEGKRGERTVQHWRDLGNGRRKLMARVYSRHFRVPGLAPGEVIRFELERRFKPSVEARVLKPDMVRDLWLRHFVAMCPDSGRVKIGERDSVLMKLAERVEAGEITYRDLEQADAFLQLERLGLLGSVYPASVIKARRRKMKRLGVGLSDVGAQDVSVDVGQVVGLGVDRRHWGRAGA